MSKNIYNKLKNWLKRGGFVYDAARQAVLSLIILTGFAMPTSFITSGSSWLFNGSGHTLNEVFLHNNPSPKPAGEISTYITAYSSTPEETDNTPFVTAAGTKVRPGIIAANFLPFGTRIMIPELFGDQIFTVEDRMAKKHGGKIDIWLPSKSQAINFGIKYSKIVVLES